MTTPTTTTDHHEEPTMYRTFSYRPQRPGTTTQHPLDTDTDPRVAHLVAHGMAAGGAYTGEAFVVRTDSGHLLLVGQGQSCHTTPDPLHAFAHCQGRAVAHVALLEQGKSTWMCRQCLVRHLGYDVPVHATDLDRRSPEQREFDEATDAALEGIRLDFDGDKGYLTGEQITVAAEPIAADFGMPLDMVESDLAARLEAEHYTIEP